MRELMIFENKEFGEIRGLNIDGRPWFVGKDVAEKLGYYNPSKAVSTHCKNGIKEVVDVSSQNGNPHTKARNTQTMTLISEGDVYRLIIKSKMPKAQQFESWVMDEVLPQIRQTGGYIPVNEQMTDEEIMARALIVAQNTIKKKDELIQNQAKQLEEQKPLVNFANTISQSSDSISIGDFAKLVKDENIKLGRNKLFQWLRDNKYLMKDNKPYQKYIDNKYFEIIEYNYKTPYGDKIGIKTLVTGVGQIKLVEKLRMISK